MLTLLLIEQNLIRAVQARGPCNNTILVLPQAVMNADLTSLQINRSKKKKTYMQILYFYLNVKSNDKNPENPASILD